MMGTYRSDLDVARAIVRDWLDRQQPLKRRRRDRPAAYVLEACRIVLEDSLHYDESRVWVDVEACTGCGVDHPEMEFKLVNGVYRARCYRSGLELVYDRDSDALLPTLVSELPDSS